MNGRLMLDQPHIVKGRILFAPSRRCFGNIEREGKDPEEILRRLSELKTLLFWVQRRGDGTVNYILYTTEGVYSLAKTDSEALLLTSFRPATLRDNNTCLKTGISVQAEQGTTISIKMNDAHQLFCVYHNGQKLAEIPPMAEAGGLLFPLLERLSDFNKSKRPEKSADEPYIVPEEAEEYLSIAEAYTRTDADLELAKVQQIAPLTCWDFHPAPSYDRQDKIAYSVFVDSCDTENYSVNTKVQIELEEDKILTASIVAEGEENGSKTVTLLFDEQISFSSLPQSGQIRLSYSDVQNEVRQDVIDGIRKGETSAAYLADVLGSYKTGGFTHKDMRELDEDLHSRQYPPNQSQIDAIHRGIETDDILLVLGPPGTGKTTVILEWVKYFIKHEGKRVLISSQNNKAVDNVLERLTREKDISAIRAGNESKVQANMYPYLLENRLKQLREDVEATVSANLDRIEEVDRGYQEYMDQAYAVIACLKKMEETAQHLETEAGSKYYGEQTVLLQERKNQRIFAERMRKELRTVWFCEKCMVDPDKHPILRFLLTPVRGFFGRRMDRALNAYSEDYMQYVKSINQGMRAYERLSQMLQDRDLLKIAETIAEAEREKSLAEQSLRKPVDDSLIWPDKEWPALSIPCTADQLKQLIAGIQSRRRRMECLRDASVEWNEHISSQSNYALSDLLMESVDLVGGTCIGINSQRKFANVNFDVTIIDESGQIQIHNALVPMSRSPKVIMLGDHLQIPPIADEDQIALCEESGVDSSLLSTSLFERLYENLPEEKKALLDTQYRMPAQIADLLSQWFYDGKYKSFSGKRDLPSICPKLFKSPFALVSTSDAGRRRFEYKPEKGAGNHFEAELIVSMVRALLSGKYGKPLSPSDLGIISPYGEQVNNIRRKLKKAIPSLTPDEIHDMVASLDSFQGQERTVILYSCTRSNQIPAQKSRIGFLRELRRLNVALSRPLKGLVFIGDIDFLSACRNGEGKGSETEFSEFIKLMRQYAEREGEFLLSGDFQKRLEAE